MKKLSGLGVLVTSVALACVVGCASDSGNSQQSQPAAQTAPPPQPAPPPPKPKPKKDKRPIEQRLVVGMTMDDVKTACGNPKNVAMNSDGSATWVYNNAQNAFIPNYTLFGGKIHYVMVYFDTTGKVKSWNAS